MGAMAGEFVNLRKRVSINEHLDTFASSLLAFGVLLLYCSGRSGVDGFIDSRAKVINFSRGGM
jgi:hypothetical protein